MATSTKDRLVDAGAELFARQGYTGTGVKQILAAARAPYGSLYHHFPGGKDELTAVAIERSGGRFQALVEAVLDGQDDLVSGVRAVFVEAAEVVRATDYADACPIETVALEVASTNEPLRLATARVFDAWLDAAAARGEAAGMAPADARVWANTFVATLEGAFVLCRATRTPDALHAAADTLAMLTRSLLAHPA